MSLSQREEQENRRNDNDLRNIIRVVKPRTKAVRHVERIDKIRNSYKMFVVSNLKLQT